MARSHQQLPVVRQLRRPLVENRFAVFVKMTVGSWLLCQASERDNLRSYSCKHDHEAIWHRAWSRTLFTAALSAQGL